MKIVLVFPRLKHETCGDPPLGLAYLAAYLRENTNVQVSILDTAFLSVSKIYAYFLKERPDMAGVYFSTPVYDIGMEIVKAAKNAGVFVVAGGPHATVAPESLADKVNAVVMGEGERALAELIRFYAANNKVEVKNISGEPFTDLDVLPFPARDLLDMARYIDNCQYFDCVDMKLKATTMIASRGCSFKCTYCQPTLNKLFGNKIRFRSPGNLISEIKEIREKYSVDAIFLHDDALIFNKEWLSDFCGKLILEVPGLIWGCNTRADLVDEGLLDLMHESGLRCLHIGAESASQRIIDDIYKKGIKLSDVRSAVEMSKKRGIHTMCFFMLGAPTETKNEIEDTIKFAGSLPLDEAVFNIATPMPGTELYNLAKKIGLGISDRWQDFNYYSQRAYDNAGLGSKRIKYYQLKALFKFYLGFYRLKYVLKHFYSFKGMRKLLRKIKRFF